MTSRPNSNVIPVSLVKNKVFKAMNNLWNNARTIKFNFFGILMLVVFSDNTFSQQLDDAICLSGGQMELDYRKKPWKGNNQFLETYLEKIRYFEERDTIRYSVPIKFWVYRNNHGEGGATFSDVKKFIEDLNYNNQYNQTGIQFYIREIEFIDRTARQVFGYYLEAPIQTMFRHTKPALNVYLVDRFKKKQESRKLVKGTYNIFTKSVILQRDNSSTALSHEIGHYFGLLHPHRHYKSGKSKQEPVSRTRIKNDEDSGIPLCELHGDLLSDTEAEPKLTFLVDNDCSFTGIVLKDAWGDNYRSVVNNIMSYPTHTRCRNSFTLQQKAVMLYSASVNKYAKFWDIQNPSNSKYLFDKYEPDDYKNMASDLEPGKIQEHTFHKIFLKPGKDKSDTSDWVKFEVKEENKRNIKIKVKPALNHSNLLQVTLFDKNYIKLCDVSGTSNQDILQLEFKNVVSDWYYILIKKMQQNSDTILQYNVQVELSDN